MLPPGNSVPEKQYFHQPKILSVGVLLTISPYESIMVFPTATWQSFCML